MKTAQPYHHHRKSPRKSSIEAVCLLAITAIGAPLLHAQRVAVATRILPALAANAAVDAGQLPISQPLTLTVRLRPSALQTAALDQLLAAQTDPASPIYHQWLTPEQFAAQFGPTSDQLSAVTNWLQSQGLAVVAVSPAHTRLTVTGTAGQAEQTFAVRLRSFRVDGLPHFANAVEPSAPAEVADLIAGISGLDDLPQPPSSRVSLAGSVDPVLPIEAHTSLNQTSTYPEAASEPDSITTVASAIDANTGPILTLTTAACSADLTPAETDAYKALFRQANAQGISVLTTSSCAAAISSSFPASLAEVTALTTSPRDVVTAAGAEVRPTWQAAPGLPLDSLRHEPDLTTSSAAVFAQTIATLNQRTGSRLGNINATLYSLAKVPGLFTQPDTAPAAPSAGNWEPATGLGLIDLQTLLKVYPRGSYATTLDFQSSTYSVSYGTPFTLRVNINASSFATSPPTGTVTFTASPQGVLGSAAVNNGSATLDSGVLPTGTYSIVATYSGDSNYSASSKGGVNIYVAIVNAGLAATLSPSISVPYGATATATATVTLPGSSASPSGDVYAQIQGVTGAFYTATLSPNPGGNSATANIVLSIPSPGSYTVEVRCQGSQNFQCQTPVLLPIKTVKGYTNTSVTVNPAAPQAGEPIYITASVANAGNGNGTYTYGGSIGFYDSGKLIASAPVATNQATASASLSGVRTHYLTAVYSGDTNWNTSTSAAVSVLPTILPTALIVTTNTNGSNSLSGVNLVLTGSVTANTNFGTGPTGYVTFFDTYNGAVLPLGNGSAIVANGPNASNVRLTTTGLLPGLHHIYAQYTGDDNYASATSAVTTLSISDFSVTMNPSTLTITRGQSGTATALIGATGGFTGSISLGCSPPGDSEATCSVSPASVPVGQSATISFLTIAPRTNRSPQRVSSVSGWSYATGATLASLFFFLAPRRRRSLPSLVLILLAVSLTADLGCGLGTTIAAASGGGTGTNPSDPGTPLGTQNYIITAAGSDGVNSVRHTYQYQVTIQ